MKKIILLISFLLFFVSIAFCDALVVPFSCYPLELQERFAEYNLKLDLDSIERTVDSWGFLVNEGTRYTIYTYRPATKEELGLLLEIINSNKAISKPERGEDG